MVLVQNQTTSWGMGSHPLSHGAVSYPQMFTCSHGEAFFPFPLVGEGAPFNWRPSADAVAGNGGDGGAERALGRASAPTLAPYKGRFFSFPPPRGGRG